MRIFLLIFLVIPLAELWLMIHVGSWIGALPTVILVVATALVGLALLRIQGYATALQARSKLQNRELPALEMVSGVILALSGVLLLLPGFATDTLGFLGLVPPVRRWLAARALAQMGRGTWVSARMFNGRIYSGKPFHKTEQRTFEGEFRRDSDDKRDLPPRD